MTNVYGSLIAVCFLMLTACNKNEPIEFADEDFLVFGHFYGECAGEGCVETFKLTNDKLFEDSKDIYATADFDFFELSQDKFELVKDLTDFFPSKLLDESVSTFGCPDCGDWGGLLVQYSANGNTSTWLIDQMIDDVPNYLHEFIEQINIKIELIHQ